MVNLNVNWVQYVAIVSNVHKVHCFLSCLRVWCLLCEFGVDFTWNIVFLDRSKLKLHWGHILHRLTRTHTSILQFSYSYQCNFLKYQRIGCFSRIMHWWTKIFKKSLFNPLFKTKWFINSNRDVNKNNKVLLWFS